ncbi:MAG: hypothetical protein AAGB22_11510, partial [Bacteroidota bacterium]
MVAWHADLMATTRNHDSYGHMVTTSFISDDLELYNGNTNPGTILQVWDYNVNGFRNSMLALSDFFHYHHYPTPIHHGNYSQSTWIMEDNKEEHFDKLTEIKNLAPGKPVVIGEYAATRITNRSDDVFGWGFLRNRDPGAINQHEMQWSALLQGHMAPPMHWVWQGFVNPTTNASTEWMKQLNGLSSFANAIGTIDPKVQVRHKDITPELSHYYLEDRKQKKVFGWAQNSNFSFHNLVGPFTPGTKGDDDGDFLNRHPYMISGATQNPPSWPTTLAYHQLTAQAPYRGMYSVSWYNTETGNIAHTEQVATCDGVLTLSIPVSMTNARYGDVAFVATLQGFGESTKETPSFISSVANPLQLSPKGASVNGVFYVDHATQQFGRSYLDNGDWQYEVISIGAPTPYANTGFYASDEPDFSVYYCGVDNGVKNFYRLYKNGSSWQVQQLTNATNLSIDQRSDILQQNGSLFFISDQGRIH